MQPWRQLALQAWDCSKAPSGAGDKCRCEVTVAPIGLQRRLWKSLTRRKRERTLLSGGLLR